MQCISFWSIVIKNEERYVTIKKHEKGVHASVRKGKCSESLKWMQAGVAKGGGAQGGHVPPPLIWEFKKKKGEVLGIGLCHYT